MRTPSFFYYFYTKYQKNANIMPFELNGTIGDKTYTDQQVSAQVLIDAFKLKEQLSDKKKVVAFDMGDTFKSNTGGREQQAAAFTLPNVFTVQHEGNSLQIRYYERISMKNIANGQLKQYFPEKLIFDGSTVSAHKTKDLEKVVFFLLHPRNRSSAVYVPGEKWYFSTRNDEKSATNSLDFQMLELEFKQEILKGDIAKIRNRATGMKMGNLSELTDNEVRTLLISQYESARKKGRNVEESEKLGLQFIQTFNEYTSQIRGSMYKAIELGIIYGYPDVKSGKYLYRWENVTAASKMKGENILECPKGANSEDTLYLHLVENIDTIGKTLTLQIAEIEAKRTEPKDTKPALKEVKK